MEGADYQGVIADLEAKYTALGQLILSLKAAASGNVEAIKVDGAGSNPAVLPAISN